MANIRSRGEGCTVNLDILCCVTKCSETNEDDSRGQAEII